jgi:hypothetical protein
MEYHNQVNINPNIIKSLNFFGKITKSDKFNWEIPRPWAIFPTLYFQILDQNTENFKSF